MILFENVVRVLENEPRTPIGKKKLRLYNNENEDKTSQNKSDLNYNSEQKNNFGSENPDLLYIYRNKTRFDETFLELKLEFLFIFCIVENGTYVDAARPKTGINP